MTDLKRAGQGRLFDRYADSYASAVNQSITASGEDVTHFATIKAKLVSRHAPALENASLLDFGCGGGLSTAALASALPGSVRITGVDPSHASIAQARERNPAGTFIELEGDALPFPDHTFDIAFAANVFHHIDAALHDLWLGELRRVLRPGGEFFLFEHNPHNPLTRKSVRDCPFDEGVTLLTPGYARAAFARAGLVADSPYYYFFFPRALAALRFSEPALSHVPLGAQYFLKGARR